MELKLNFSTKANNVLSDYHFNKYRMKKMEVARKLNRYLHIGLNQIFLNIFNKKIEFENSDDYIYLIIAFKNNILGHDN